jgi:glutathione S-transferase
MSLTLYYAPRSSASPILWILAELGVPYEGIPIDFAKNEQKQPALMAHNPMGQVPTLVDDGQGMFESTAIMIHLGDKHGVERGLWPAPGTPAHMVALSWTAWFSVTLGGTLRLIMLNESEWLPEDTRNAKQAAWGKERLRTLMKLLDERLAQQPYVVGESFTLLDAYAAAALGWGTGVVGFDLATTPSIAAWLQRCMAREAAKQMQ